MLVIKRRTWIQDAVRMYKVIVDEGVIGSVGPLRTKTLSLVPGEHSVRLAIGATGRSCSATVPVPVRPGQQCTVRTVRRGGLLSFLKLPLAFPEGARSLAEDRPIASRYYEGPWIHVKVETVGS